MLSEVPVLLTATVTAALRASVTVSAQLPVSAPFCSVKLTWPPLDDGVSELELVSCATNAFDDGV